MKNRSLGADVKGVLRETGPLHRGACRGEKPVKHVKLSAIKGSATYLILAGGWIAYSDRLLSELDLERGTSLLLQQYKGIGFVFVSSVMLYFMLRYEHRLARRARDADLAAQQDLIRYLAQAAEWHDDETGGHILRVSSFVFEIAAEYGLPAKRCDELRLASSAHDIGKIGVPDSVVMFDGAYSAEQRAQMQAHTLIGGQILRGADSGLIETARKIAVSHHERWDGTGYPAGLAGEEIPLEARITAVADVFDALVSPRRYKPAWEWHDAVNEIASGAGSQFDPEVVAAFLRAEHSVRRAWERYGADTSADDLKLAG